MRLRFGTGSLHTPTSPWPARRSALAAMLAVAALAIQIPSVAHEESSAGFALAYIAIRVLTVVLNLRAYRHVPLARPLIGRYVAAFSFSVALWTVSLAVPEPWRFVVWGSGWWWILGFQP